MNLLYFISFRSGIVAMADRAKLFHSLRQVYETLGIYPPETNQTYRFKWKTVFFVSTTVLLFITSFGSRDCGWVRNIVLYICVTMHSNKQYFDNHLEDANHFRVIEEVWEFDWIKWVRNTFQAYKSNVKIFAMIQIDQSQIH